METTNHKTIIHAAVSQETEKNISVLANSEKRSKSAMISVLLEEAIEHRIKQLSNKT